MRIARTVYWSAEAGTTVPMDQWLGIAENRFSPGLREMCCRESLHCPFEVVSENLARTAQVTLSGSTVRTLVEHQGQAVLSAQRSGALPPGFTAADCTDQTVISGVDGVMVPLVTEEQKRKRRQTEAAKRLEQGRRSTAWVGRPRKGSDGDYKELKIVSFYDPDKSHCHVVGTAGNHEALGKIMRREAGRLHLAQAKIKYAVTDGAEWISRQYRKQLPMLDEHILDYYHLKEHVVHVGQVLYGQGTAKAQAWCDTMLGVVWEQGSLALLHRLDPYRRRHRGTKRKALASLHQYVGHRVSMTDYPAFGAQGYDCGSGPTESKCGTLTDRLKGAGMRWDKDNAEAIMALASLYQSGLWHAYWKTQRTAA